MPCPQPQFVDQGAVDLDHEEDLFSGSDDNNTSYTDHEKSDSEDDDTKNSRPPVCILVLQLPMPSVCRTYLETCFGELDIIEKACIELAAKDLRKYSDESFQTLVKLHTLLLEQIVKLGTLPIPSTVAKRLPVRMFRSGIQPVSLLYQHIPPGQQTLLLAFLQRSYSMAMLLYESFPKLPNPWIACQYEIAKVLRDVDSEHGLIWGKNVQYWDTRQDPVDSTAFPEGVPGGACRISCD